MDHFVDDDVFETMIWFLPQLGIEADRPCARIASSPFGFHMPHVKLIGNDTQEAVCPKNLVAFDF
jgi:hypothetical protein